MLASPNLPICNIAWTGYKISAADELYHTIWENAEGNETISLPINVKVVAVNNNNNAVNSNNNANDWIVDVEIVDHDLYSMNDINNDRVLVKNEKLKELIDNSKIFFKKQGILINWSELSKLSVKKQIYNLAMISPISVEEKQKLIEIAQLDEIANTLIEITKFNFYDDLYQNKILQ